MTYLFKLYYTVLVHPGLKRSWMTIQARYYHPDIRKHVDKIHCDYCQHIKIPWKEIELLSEWYLTNTQWYKVTIDLIGPHSAKTEHFSGNFMHWHALTCIGTTTNLVQYVYIDTKSSDAFRKFEQTWLVASLTPKPGTSCPQ